MSSRSVFCIAPSRAQADRIVRGLKGAEFSHADISILFLAQKTAKERAFASIGSASARAAAAQPAGAALGVLGWLAGIGPCTISGIGPLIAAGPIAAGLGDATVGGVAGGLTDFGVPQAEALRYENKIKAGHILLSVQTENPDKSDQAREIFVAAGAEDLCTMMVVPTTRRASHNASALPHASVA